MQPRSLWYRLIYLWQHLLSWPVEIISIRLYQASVLDTYEGILLVDLSQNEKCGTAFVAVTRQAIDLIRKYDARAFERLRREVRYIVCEPWEIGGAYYRGRRAILVCFPFYWPEHPREDTEWYLAYYAAVLVHEATHGYLDSRCFAYTKATRSRIERICCSAQRRFASRLQSEEFDFGRDLVPPFDEDRWKARWNRWVWTKNMWLRIKSTHAMDQEKHR